MPIRPIDPEQPEPAVLREAARILREGGLVAFPTETVYGLGANALDAAAVARIYTAKGRPSYNPLILHVPDATAARELVTQWPELAVRLTEQLWPGPLTLVLPKRARVPDLATAGLPTVAVRAPAHPVARALIAAAGVPLAAPSANRFQGVSPTRASHVARSLGPDAALILDGGPTSVGIESTVIDLSGRRPVLLRLGGMPRAEIEAITGPLLEPSELVSELVTEQGDQAPRPSPGMVDRHYAPAGRVEVLAGEALRARLSSAVDSELTGAIVYGNHAAKLDHVLRLPADPEGYGRLLYAALHTLDELGCSWILVEELPAAPAWAALADRLTRASR